MKKAFQFVVVFALGLLILPALKMIHQRVTVGQFVEFGELSPDKTILIQPCDSISRDYFLLFENWSNTYHEMPSFEINGRVVSGLGVKKCPWRDGAMFVTSKENAALKITLSGPMELRIKGLKVGQSGKLVVCAKPYLALQSNTRNVPEFDILRVPD